MNYSQSLTSLLNPHGLREPQFHWWRGASGAWTITTVFPSYRISSLLWWDCPAVYILTAPGQGILRRPLYIGETMEIGRRLREHRVDIHSHAMALGMTELHIHLLAEQKDELRRIEADLLSMHPTPLNEQLNPLGRLFGLGAIGLK